MKLKLKENPKEWRKAAWLGALGLGVLSTVLRWRRVLPTAAWVAILIVLAGVAVGAWIWPRAFRGWYRLSNRLGFGLSQISGHILLAMFFFVVLTPLGLALRLFGKDFLRLKPPRDAATYWNKTKESSPLDRLF